MYTYLAKPLLALCLMLSVTHYAQSYAGIMGLCLPTTHPIPFHPPTHPLICATCGITVDVKKLLKM